MPHLRRRQGRVRDLRVRTEDAGERAVRDDADGDAAAGPRKRRTPRLRGRGLPRLSLEPPGSHLLAGTGSLAALGPLRLSAAAAAAVLALSSTGHVVALAALLAVLVARPAAVGAVLFAGIAMVERWGTTSLDAVAGAQTVLGPGGVVGPGPAAASAWLAAAALVLATPLAGGHDPDDASVALEDDRASDPSPAPSSSRRRRRRPKPAALVAALALGSAAAAAVAGPDLASDLVLRLGTTAAAVVVAVAVAMLRRQQVTAALALVAGLAAAGFAAAVATGRVGL